MATAMIVRQVTVRFDETYTRGLDEIERLEAAAALSAAAHRARRRRVARRRRTTAIAVGIAGILGAVAALAGPL